MTAWTGEGTVVPASDGLNLAAVRGICRLTLADSAKWADAALDEWIRAAIRLYSAHFPRVWRKTLTLATGTQAYSLPGGYDAVSLLTVEYPAGETPPRFLRQVSETSSDFAFFGACYAVRGTDEGDTATELGQIVFSEVVATGETAVVEYLGPHVLPVVASDGDAVTVPAQHVEAITAFVRFAALYELETDEAVIVDDSSIVLSQLGQETRRAWNMYKEVMDRIVWLAPGPLHSSPVVSWGDIGL